MKYSIGTKINTKSNAILTITHVDKRGVRYDIYDLDSEETHKNFLSWNGMERCVKKYGWVVVPEHQFPEELFEL